MQVGKLERMHMQCFPLVMLLQLTFDNSNLHTAQNERFCCCLETRFTWAVLTKCCCVETHVSLGLYSQNAVVWRHTFHLGCSHKMLCGDTRFTWAVLTKCCVETHISLGLFSQNVVWRHTFHLGCAHKSCDQYSPFPLYLQLQPPAPTGLHSAPNYTPSG
jgi:hypothetical protein